MRSAAFAEHLHPFPHENGHYWLLENLGSAESPIITRGNFYAIKKVMEAPPSVTGLVDVYMSGERRREPLGPVALVPSAPASLMP